MSKNDESSGGTGRQSGKWLLRPLAVFLLLAFFWAAADLSVRNLWRALTFSPMFALIFRALEDALILPPFLIIGASAILIVFFWGKMKTRRAKVLLALLGGIGTLLLSVLFAHVNGVFFIDVLFSLIDYVKAGGLAGL